MLLIMALVCININTMPINSEIEPLLVQAKNASILSFITYKIITVYLLISFLLQCLVKPPVKESTRPVDLVLHSDVRAVERADFDHQVWFFLMFV